MSTAETYQRLADLNQAFALLARHGISDEEIEHLALGTGTNITPKYTPFFIATYQDRDSKFIGWQYDYLKLLPWITDLELIRWLEEKPPYNTSFHSKDTPGLWVHCVRRGTEDYPNDLNPIDPNDPRNVPF